MEQPDAGTFEVGETVVTAYVDQQHAAIDPDKTVYQVVSGGSEFVKVGVRTSTRVRTLPASTFPVPIKRNSVACYRAGSGTACTWR